MTTIAIDLPTAKISQIERVATHLKKPISSLLSDIVLSVLPPVDDVPEEMQVELLQMTWLETSSLWRIAEGQMDLAQQTHLRTLTQQQIEQSLTETEREELTELQQEYGRATLRKAHAYMLLGSRGGIHQHR